MVLFMVSNLVGLRKWNALEILIGFEISLLVYGACDVTVLCGGPSMFVCFGVRASDFNRSS